MWSRRRDRAEDTVRTDAVEAASALAVHLQGGGSLLPVRWTAFHLRPVKSPSRT